ncbi:MAG: Na+/H+ antiporter NhaC family protein [Tissierellia bacterium]|nr:Na+/H+ antiporter NhaC family protein [Tissierellia bacterium]
MSFYIICTIFTASIIICAISGYNIIYALLIGLILFIYDGYEKGFRGRDFLKMFKSGINFAKNLIIIFLLIGILTGLWRESGTIQYLVLQGTKWINVRYFYFWAFILTAIMSIITGSCMGTASTIGVVIAIMAKAFQMNPIISGGALLSGIMVGDRMSPVSSSAQLVAKLSDTKVSNNLPRMLKTSIIPTLITAMIFALIIGNDVPQKGVDIISNLQASHQISHYSLLPALTIIVLAIFKLDSIKLLSISSIISAAIALIIKKVRLTELIKVMTFGYNSGEEALKILNGGGIYGMRVMIITVLISAFYFGIFEKTKFMDPFKKKINKLQISIGHFPALIIVSIILSMITCTQTLSVMMAGNLIKDTYKNKNLMAIDFENSVIVIPAIIPWNITAGIAIEIFNVPKISIVMNLFCLILPIYYFLTRTRYKKILNSSK